jgi:hypothetical protein
VVIDMIYRSYHRHWTNAESSEVIGHTRESTQEDLFGAIEKGDFPKCKVQVQIMTDAQAQEWSERTGWNPSQPATIARIGGTYASLLNASAASFLA